jgi:diadenosine tetraphosphate (Ap4A) HIT family hydrolase
MSTQHIKTGCKFCPPRKDFAVVGENNHAVAIICDTAKTWGHSLIIPKSHSSNIVSPGMDETI